ncbi:hypothetical protein [Nonomuraea roseoviolacea]|uniref:Membrane protein YphA (DoxX/SURF4 family) n=1 Tax=Nonomuraea roseoviolacea subsp. carminata TaxID=160689 RepID=A0ABT1KFP7_9ACTN|nr:hypothetical protein [Nonomuraea roseoviolacea]MCP2352846.1 putative membrane protein YphA (DoxX/SURF4 family) [Nonomuraea roseoviolacea subsp. carminata]
MAAHVLFVACAAPAVVVPGWRWTPALALAALSLMAASFPKRLPNHFAVAWFMLLAFAADRAFGLSSGHGGGLDDAYALGLVRQFTIITYVVAGLHKLNRDYFDPRLSCGSGLLMEYALRLGVSPRRVPRRLARALSAAVVAAEFGAAAGLALGVRTLWVIAAAVVMHAFFGFAGHAQFSLIMLGGLLAFTDVESLAPLSVPGLCALLAGSGVVAATLGGFRGFRLRHVALLDNVVLAVVSLWCLLTVLGPGAGEAGGTWAVPFALAPYATTCLVLLYLVNGLAPYLGLKFDFSMAMFSNLRPDRRSHFFLPMPRHGLMPRYFEISGLGGAGTDGRAGTAELLTEMFPDVYTHRYSAGYVHAAVRRLRHRFEPGAEVYLRCVESATREVHRLPVSPSAGSGFLRGRERFSVYPYALPLRRALPLCC